MIINLNLMPDLTHHTLFINQKSLAADTHILLPIHILLAIDPIKLRDASISIGKKWERQTILIRKFPVRIHIISTHTQNNNTTLLHKVVRIPESTGLFRTTRRVIFWIKIKNDRFP